MKHVYTLLKKHKTARDDDRILIQLYHYHVDGLKQFVPFNIVRRLTAPESITRARRHIQNRLRLCRPSKERKSGRKKQEQKFREYY